MRGWIKICGNTSLEDARLAIDSGADALGFIFAPSPRRVTTDEAIAISRHLPGVIEKIGVFVDARLEQIVSAVRACGLSGVQLHSDCETELPARLHAEFNANLRILRVVHFGPDAGQQAQAFAADRDVDGILVDSRTATAVGGTGIAYDWVAARRSVFGAPGSGHLIAAGGLNPENVEAAITVLKPWGVDVVSGVEASPGRKSPEKLEKFIRAARAAFERI